MAKKYTLYFKGKDKNGNNYDVPIVSLPLKELDRYTSDYDDYNSLFNSLPVEIKDFIANYLCFGINIKESFYITDYDFTPIMDVIFKPDSDVLYIEPRELEKLLQDNVMTSEEYRKSKLKSISDDKLKRKYSFYTYLYNTYVKNDCIKCMIDLYYVSKNNIDEDDMYIEAIATDKVNLLVLAKKLSQRQEARRNLTYEFKKCIMNDGILDNDLISYRRKETTEFIKPLSSMIINFDKFKKEYEKNK